jgi:hypothetical protein
MTRTTRLRICDINGNIVDKMLSEMKDINAKWDKTIFPSFKWEKLSRRFDYCSAVAVRLNNESKKYLEEIL